MNGRASVGFIHICIMQHSTNLCSPSAHAVCELHFWGTQGGLIGSAIFASHHYPKGRCHHCVFHNAAWWVPNHNLETPLPFQLDASLAWSKQTDALFQALQVRN